MKWALIGLAVVGAGATVIAGLLAGPPGAIFMGFAVVVIAVCGGINFVLVGQGAGGASKRAPVRGADAKAPPRAPGMSGE